MKDRSIYTELKEEAFQNLLSQGLVLVSRYLRIEPYPRNTGIYGFSGWDKNKTKGKYRVYEASKGNIPVFMSTWYAQFLGEVFFRFPTVRSSWHRPPGGGAFRKYIVEVSIDGHSELLYFEPGSGMKTKIESAVRTMTDLDCHEYVWRIHKNQFGNGEYLLDCYYHDEDLSTVNRGRMSEAMTEIVSQDPGPKTDWDNHPEDVKMSVKDKKLLKDERLSSVVYHLKDKIIPRLAHRPDESDYISLLTDLAGLSITEAKDVYKFRSIYRLP